MSNRGQKIAQYGNDTNFSLKASREGMIQLAQLFDIFSIASGLQINHAKYVVFWIEGRKESRPACKKEEFRWTWASSEAISKLLNTLFGLSFSSANVHKFL
jgi:hypothetical protein